MPRRANWSKQTRAVLSVLLKERERWWHGYDLSGETGLKSGTLYPILMRLKEQGLLVSQWQASAIAGRPPRHIYQLSASGRLLAIEQAEEMAATPTRQGKATLTDKGKQT